MKALHASAIHFLLFTIWGENFSIRFALIEDAFNWRAIERKHMQLKIFSTRVKRKLCGLCAILVLGSKPKSSQTRLDY